MKGYLKPIFALAALALLMTGTVQADSGTVIDLLRTTDGVEIYVDGELLEMDFDSEGHKVIMIRKHVVTED